MLPQAFGPFKNKNIRKIMIKIINKVNKIYIRDEFSYAYLSELSPLVNSKFEKYPDFTCLLKSKLPKYFNHKIHQVCIVLNSRMIDKTNSAEEYISLIINFINSLKKVFKSFF